ncbi:hypothetical protein CFOL_v3_35463 [Cephalotus follicularis]|uniref:Uncharacterized protein n=1 Tax=Cephalotus follicularis TaxID=3775 RepID=A0A1Q3DI43_CEPFO|nr:hypothetical protein CFOL_v3_35463 [Cephalotus follicularis]
MEAIMSMRHLVMKFSTRFGVGEVRGDQQVARQCYKTIVMDKGKEKALPIALPIGNVKLRGDVEPNVHSLLRKLYKYPWRWVMKKELSKSAYNLERWRKGNS